MFFLFGAPVLLGAICALVGISEAASSVLDIAGEKPPPFHSRPDVRAPPLNIVEVQKDLISPGHILWTPNKRPAIYDSHGQVVWDGGADGFIPGSSFGLHVCDYQGVSGKHLCLHQGMQPGQYSHGYGLIINEHYQIVRAIQLPGGSDMHEFRTVHNGNAVICTTYVPLQADLTESNVTEGLGWVQDSIFREVDISGSENRITFEWHSSDHIPLDRSSVQREKMAGVDVRFEGYDYFHINSVDKNSDGDYLISSRHTNALYKISGVDGQIMWRLSNAPDSNFTIIDFEMMGQHDARWISETDTHCVISFMNNNANGQSNISSTSYAATVLVNYVSRTAALVSQFHAPEEDFLTMSQGSMQTMPNSNVFVGWGAKALITEHLSDGTLIAYAKAPWIQSYRTFKSNWTGIPLTPPNLWTYAKTPSSQLRCFMSWNGATEVTSWNIYTGPSKSGPFTQVASAWKHTFETNITIANYQPWAFAEAVAANGAGLRNSSVTKTWSPGPELAALCDDDACPLSALPTAHSAAPAEAKQASNETSSEEEQQSSNETSETTPVAETENLPLATNGVTEQSLASAAATMCPMPAMHQDALSGFGGGDRSRPLFGESWLVPLFTGMGLATAVFGVANFLRGGVRHAYMRLGSGQGRGWDRL